MIIKPNNITITKSNLNTQIPDTLIHPQSSHEYIEGKNTNKIEKKNQKKTPLSVEIDRGESKTR